MFPELVASTTHRVPSGSVPSPPLPSFPFHACCRWRSGAFFSATASHWEPGCCRTPTLQAGGGGTGCDGAPPGAGQKRRSVEARAGSRTAELPLPPPLGRHASMRARSESGGRVQLGRLRLLAGAAASLRGLWLRYVDGEPPLSVRPSCRPSWQDPAALSCTALGREAWGGGHKNGMQLSERAPLHAGFAKRMRTDALYI
eukprot:jgi/Mesen1/1157/ME000124S00191